MSAQRMPDERLFQIGEADVSDPMDVLAMYGELFAETKRARASEAELVEAAERLLEHYSDGLPEHMVEEFRAAIAKATGGES